MGGAGAPRTWTALPETPAAGFPAAPAVCLRGRALLYPECVCLRGRPRCTPECVRPVLCLRGRALLHECV